MLPEKNGFQVLKELREKGITTPVLIMTAKESLDDKGHGFELGADDYLTKPFAIEELLARIRVALKHHEADSLNSPTIPQTAATSTFTIKGVSLDVDRREVCVKNDTIELTTKEFEVLRMLMEHAGVVMSRERIASEALGYEFAGETNNVDVHIAHLRAKIDDRYNIKLITTVRGVGYVIREA
ncbi:MAG: response regulator transcription factor, partial [Atopobium sp.]|nr:response regulator transcription factor [Atopobium sp.]